MYFFGGLKIISFTRWDSIFGFPVYGDQNELIKISTRTKGKETHHQGI